MGWEDEEHRRAIHGEDDNGSHAWNWAIGLILSCAVVFAVFKLIEQLVGG